MDLPKSIIHNKKSPVLCITRAMIVALLLSCAPPLHAQLVDTGWIVSSKKLDTPFYYKPYTETGKYIKNVFSKLEYLTDKPLDELPGELHPLRLSIGDYMKANAIQKATSKNNKYYVGPNGTKNGSDFDFDTHDLPDKLTRLSFCAGFDPIVYTSLIKQESRFKRYIISNTGATGFTQLTGQGITEVTEQLGLASPNYHAENAPTVFKKMIECYLGSDKKWKNVWEDGVIKKGTKSYSHIGKKSRELGNMKKIKTWLNADPDRNLIYGAILFKLYLAKHNGNYVTALKKYNVSHQNTYAKKVAKFYNSIVKNIDRSARDYDTNGNANKKRGNFSNPFKRFFSGNKTVSNDYVSFQFNNYECEVPHEPLIDELAMANLTVEFNGVNDAMEGVAENLFEQGFCRETLIAL